MNLYIKKAVNAEEITSERSVCLLLVLTLANTEQTNRYLGWFETASCEALLVLTLASNSILLPQLLEWQDLGLCHVSILGSESFVFTERNSLFF